VRVNGAYILIAAAPNRMQGGDADLVHDLPGPTLQGVRRTRNAAALVEGALQAGGVSKRRRVDVVDSEGDNDVVMTDASPSWQVGFQTIHFMLYLLNSLSLSPSFSVCLSLSCSLSLSLALSLSLSIYIYIFPAGSLSLSLSLSLHG
jgi:hypothetical protein